MDRETIPPKRKMTQEEFTSMVQRWMDYAKVNFADVYLKKANLDAIRRRMVEAGYADEKSVGDGEFIARKVAEEEAAQEQRNLLEKNTERLLLLCRLINKKPKDLSQTTVVSIGGGPGDQLCEPWFPRMAATTGANVINFDYSPAHPVDKELGIYIHIGEDRGDIFQLLLHQKTIYSFLNVGQNISIIECNNLIGSNISPSLIYTLGGLPENLKNHPQVIEMRRNLLQAAKDLLMEGGILAIDDVYWIKRNGELVAVNENGEERTSLPFSVG